MDKRSTALAMLAVTYGLSPSISAAAAAQWADADFGDLPVVVLTRGVSPYAVPGKPQSALNKALEIENAAIQREIAALSTRGRQRVVPGAGHVIHADKPQAVVDAVLEVLGQVK